jgi:nicotinate-nucleotide--dimethylbenzimidazole phosphoribosyltransferase
MDTAAQTLTDAAIQAALDAKTKPAGALGRLETLAAQIARAQQTLAPQVQSCRLILFAADHGLAVEGVSAYPQAVTRQMAANLAAGGAAATVFARTLGVHCQIVDCGIAGPPLGAQGVLAARIADGAANSLKGPAMTPDQAHASLALGAQLAQAAPEDTLALGEMGIGNSSAAALLIHKLTGLALENLVGAGTGLDGAGIAHKRAVLAAVAARSPARLGPIEALCAVGGFEIGAMAGAMQGGARAGKLLLVDGYIAGAAAACALALEPAIRDHLIFAHQSSEAGHPHLLAHLGADPLLKLEMRLGEGSGAVLAWPLVKAAAAMLRDMATFAEAGVSGRTS